MSEVRNTLPSARGDAIAQAKELKLKEDRTRADGNYDAYRDMIRQRDEALAALKASEAREGEMRAALEPFSKAAGVIEWTERATTVKYDDDAPFRCGLAWRDGEGTRTLTYGDFRRARAVLSTKEMGNG